MYGDDLNVRSFADPDTRFRFVRSPTPVDHDGYKFGEYTGEVECLECGARGDVVEHIPHFDECPQRDVRSRWWARRRQSES